MMEIGDDKELMAEFAEFKELLRHDLNQTTASAAPPVKGLERAPKTAAADQGPSPQAPRAEEAWGALHATEEEFLGEPEEELEGAGRRGLFYAAAAIVIVGLAALTWVLGPWAKTNTSEDPALATAPPLAAPEAGAPALDAAAMQSQDAAPAEEAAKPPVLEENAKASAEPAVDAVPATAAAVAPASESQSDATAAASAAPTATAPAVAPLGASIPVPAGAAAAPQLAPLPTAAAASASTTPAPIEPAPPPAAAAPSKAIEPPQTAAPAKPAPAARHAAAPATPVSEPPTAAAETIEAPKSAPRAKVAKPKKPAKPITSRPKPAPAEPVAVASPEPVAPPPPPPPASDGPFSFVKKSVNAVGSAIGGFVR